MSGRLSALIATPVALLTYFHEISHRGNLTDIRQGAQKFQIGLIPHGHFLGRLAWTFVFRLTFSASFTAFEIITQKLLIFFLYLLEFQRSLLDF